MTTTKPWLRGARLGAAAILGLGLMLPTVTACSSPAGETEQVEESEDSGEMSGDSDTEETEADSETEE